MNCSCRTCDCATAAGCFVNRCACCPIGAHSNAPRPPFRITPVPDPMASQRALAKRLQEADRAERQIRPEREDDRERDDAGQ